MKNRAHFYTYAVTRKRLRRKIILSHFENELFFLRQYAQIWMEICVKLDKLSCIHRVTALALNLQMFVCSGR